MRDRYAVWQNETTKAYYIEVPTETNVYPGKALLYAGKAYVYFENEAHAEMLVNMLNALLDEKGVLEQRVRYWTIESDCNHGRWLRCLEDMERLRASSFVTAVPSEEYEKVQAELTDLKAEADQSKAENARLKAQIDAKMEVGVPYADYERLFAENARLKAECQARQAENSVLAVECDSLKAEVERLTPLLGDIVSFDEYHKLLQQVERLTELNATLALRYDATKSMLDGCAKEIEEMEAEVERVGAENSHLHKGIYSLSLNVGQLKDEVERLQSIHSIDSIGIEQLKAEVERLTSDLQMEKENEDRLVREWQRANNEVYGLQRQVAALIDELERLRKGGQP